MRKILLGLALTFTAAQVAAQPASPDQPPSPPPGGHDILVKAIPGKSSGWHRAETDHFIVLSDGSESELRRVTANLESLRHLLARLYLGGEQGDLTARLTITLLPSRSVLRDLGLANRRYHEGPYGGGIGDQRYYDTREDGTVLALARVDQNLPMDTTMARDRDCEDMAADGADCADKPPVYHPALVRTWQAVLYGAYAQHFILSHQPAAYPRWYLDGIGALFSTVEYRRDGAVDYAGPPENYRQVTRSYGLLNIGDVLTGRYLDPAYHPMVWTPYHAWLMAQFFLYSPIKPERREQLTRYMAAIAQGTPMPQAAAAFGDMRRLQREFEVYAEKPANLARTDKHAVQSSEPVIAALSPEQAALIGPRMQLAGWTSDPAGTERLSELHQGLASLGQDSDALLLAAQADCRDGHAERCLAQAEQVLARAPDNATALAWKGAALTDRALAGPAADRAAGLTAARAVLAQAIHNDDSATLPLIFYFQSFTRAGEPVPEPAMQGMVRVARVLPEAPGPRLELAEELLREGKADLARRVLAPVLYEAGENPDKLRAQKLFAMKESAPQRSAP